MTQDRQQFQGGAGVVDVAIDRPSGAPRGWAILLHPHPLYQGTRDNKVITTMSRMLQSHGYVVLRPNFRGVGQSAGEFDEARGETADMVQVIEQFVQQAPEMPDLPWLIGGFSFGSAVAAQLYSEVAERQADPARAIAGLALPEAVLLAGVGVWRFSYREVSLPTNTFVIHGEKDDVIPLEDAYPWLQQHNLAVTVLPGVGHFFHGALVELRQQLEIYLRSLALID